MYEVLNNASKTPDPYPWLQANDPNRHVRDEEILEQSIDLSEADLSP